MTQQLVWLIPALPLLAFMLLVLAGDRLPAAVAAAVARAAAAGSALVAAVVIGVYLALLPAGGAVLQSLGQWIDAAGLSARIALRLDPLSLVPVAVVTGLAALIHLTPAADDGRHDRAWSSLLAAGLLILALADNLLLAYLGWELAGLAAYMLLRAGTDGAVAERGILLTTRVGATAVLVALLLLFSELGTLHLPTLLARAGAAWGAGDPLATAAAALLAGGLVARAAHVPLQMRLQRAPAAPVAALIHGAMPGAAAVYLIARMHALFELAPAVQAALAALGGIALIGAAACALVERDLLRLLGHATVGQTGVMMIALGLGAPVAAVFHAMTYACTGALLFLAAGALVAAGGERDLSRMGGLGRRLPGVALAFGAGAASLAALPLVAAGFYSQTAVLQAAAGGGPLPLAVLLLGILLTALYAFRALFVLLSGGSAPALPGRRPSRVQGGVLVVLAALALGSGVVGMPAPLGGWQPLPAWLHYVLPAADGSGAGVPLGEVGLMLAAVAAALAGVALAWGLSRHGPPRAQTGGGLWPRAQALGDLLAAGVRRVARPVVAVARAGASDVADGLDRRLAAMARWGHGHLGDSQSGRLRAYVAGMVGGVIVLIGIVVLP